MASTSAKVIKDIAVQGKPIAPGETVTKEQCGDAWDKWIADGSIAVGKAKAQADEEAPEPTVAEQAEAKAAEEAAKAANPSAGKGK